RPAAINCTAATLNSSVYLAFAIRFIHHLRYRHILLYRRYPKIAGKLIELNRKGKTQPATQHSASNA
ncbi:MAG: hypothetical protein NTW53_16265, partial [Burkholderiales bacterium]|nr:hypothetical protein [Burkholderiales bacterium]